MLLVYLGEASFLLLGSYFTKKETYTTTKFSSTTVSLMSSVGSNNLGIPIRLSATEKAASRFSCEADWMLLVRQDTKRCLTIVEEGNS